MVKLVLAIRRRKELSEKEFHDYWLTRHAPLVRSFAEAMRASRYVQSHTVSEDVGAAFRQARCVKSTYDGVAEVWWESLETMIAIASNEKGLDAVRTLMQDEAKFIDYENSAMFITEEHEIFNLTK
jgi:EthD domain